MVADTVLGAAAKAAVSGVSRAIGWKAKEVWRERQHAETFQAIQLVSPAGQPSGAFTANLDVDQLANLQLFLDSAEVKHLALLISSSFYLGKCGSASLSESHIKHQMRAQIYHWVGLEGAELAAVSEGVYDMLVACVYAQSDHLMTMLDGVPKATREALLKTHASIAAAQLRSSDGYSKIADLAEYRRFEEGLRSQISSLHATMRLPHAGTSRSVSYDRLFVQPRIAIDADVEEFNSVNGLASGETRVVILGDPGGGKSTSSLKFTYDVASGNLPKSPYRVPFFVVLKDYAERYQTERLSLVEYLHNLCQTPYAIEPPTGAIEHLLLNGIAVVIFDGLDELLDTSLRRVVVDVVEGFAHRYPTTQIIVTSRRIGYEEAPLDEELFLTASLEEFAPEQIENYALKWFNLDDSIEPPSRTKFAESFLQDSQYVDDLRRNPLMLSLMCGLYSGEKYIPRNRPDVYEKCAMLLFERWDKQRGINAPLAFDAGVQAAIRSLALWLYPQQSRSGLPRAELVRFMTEHLHKKRFDSEEEAEQAAIEFIDFCRGRAWVLTDVGAELYWFTHQTFLEFFAASQLVRENASAEALLTVLEPHIRVAEWDVVAQLALQALGKSVEDGADDFLQQLVLRAKDHPKPERVNALSFAARSLAFIVPRPTVLRALVRECLAVAVEGEGEDVTLPVVNLTERSAENGERVGKYYQEAISDFSSNESTRNRVFAVALCFSQVRHRHVSSPSPGNTQFGDALVAAADVRTALTPVIESARTEIPWFAAREAWEGRIPVSSVVDLHGMRAFYSCNMGGMVLAPPPVWTLVQGWVSGRETETPRRDLVDALYQAALSSPTPWLETGTSDFNPLRALDRAPLTRARGRSRSSGQVLLRSLCVLLMLPLIELRNLEPDDHLLSRRGRARPSDEANRDKAVGRSALLSRSQVML